MCYTGMLSDGDYSVAYKAVCDANFYPVSKWKKTGMCEPLQQKDGYSSEDNGQWWASKRVWWGLGSMQFGDRYLHTGSSPQKSAWPKHEQTLTYETDFWEI